MGGSKDERRMRKMVNIKREGLSGLFLESKHGTRYQREGGWGAWGGGRKGGRDVNIAFITEIWRQIGE